jgi:phage repressor protein C with HTH and peptisase S24 domain
MLSHRQIWTAIDALAERNGLSPSALARRAGLDATAFNKSKRTGADGRPRWPSTESISKVLQATSASMDEFVALLSTDEPNGGPTRRVPLLGFAQAGTGGFFDNSGFPTGTGWDEIRFPEIEDDNVYALEISGESMMPLYRDGDIILVSPSASVRKGDRVVVRTQDGEVMAKILKRRTARLIELASLNPTHPDLSYPVETVSSIQRIVWASQ